MPFDGKLFIADQDAFAKADGPARLRMLSEALRVQEIWPKEFGWDFELISRPRFDENRQLCGTAGCALGLARNLWPALCDNIGISGLDGRSGEPSCVESLFNLSTEDAQNLFLHTAPYGVRSVKDVTPAMVADAIDRYLAALPS